MQIIRKTSEVAAIPEPAIRDFLAQRIAQMEPDWAPDSWEDYGRFFVLAPGDDIHLLEAENCDYLTCSPFGEGRLGEADFSPVWESPGKRKKAQGQRSWAAVVIAHTRKISALTAV